ncbi:MAG: efflux RND transporter periplasmic adaptor subunit [candidate division WOR-3 bacterium]
MKRFKNVIIAIIIVFLLAVVTYLNIKRAKGKATKVEAIEVQYGVIEEVVRADGEIKAEKQVDIGADVVGRIEKLYVRLGDYVKKGDTLCVIDRKSYEAKVNSLKVSLNDLRNKLDKAQRDYERTKNLFEKGLISEADYENARLQYETIKSQYESTLYSLQDAEYQLSKTVILAPISGKVIGLNKEEGEIVVMGTVNNPATVIMTIAELSRMKVDAYVDESEVIKVKNGQPVRVRVTAYSDKVFRGIVKALAASPYQSTGSTTTISSGITYPVEVAITDTGVLYPGMSATCEIITARKDSALKIPVQALGKEKSGEDYIFIIKSGVVQKRYVKIGLIASNEAEIVEGLNPGDTIATGPYTTLRTLKEGQKVNVELKKEKEPFKGRPTGRPKR